MNQIYFNLISELKSSFMNALLENYFATQNQLIKSSTPQVRLSSQSIGSDFTIYDTLNKAILDYENSPNRSSSVREDARLLLYLNFDIVIFRPLNIITETTSLLQYIYNDVKIILQEADSLATENKSYEISGHQLMLAVSNKWGLLKTLSGDSW